MHQTGCIEVQEADKTNGNDMLSLGCMCANTLHTMDFLQQNDALLRVVRRKSDKMHCKCIYLWRAAQDRTAAGVADDLLI